jgi:dTDP-4-amino-4,6-dideoxygalactose transaminase
MYELARREHIVLTRFRMKRNLTDLAIFGGVKSFPEALHVGCPNIGDSGRFLERIKKSLDHRWLTNDGPYVKELEGRIATKFGVRNCIATANGTLALEIALRALDVKGEVIVPAFTFIATAHALQWQNIRPIFCDIDPITHAIDPLQVQRRLTPQTTAIIGVHIWGEPCDIESLTDIATRNKLKLIFDASHAFACTHRGYPIGNYGLAEVFSFHATKFFNTFEGGAITTNSDALATTIRLMRNFGFVGCDNAILIGTNAKMSEAHAAMGLTGLESIDDFIDINRRNYYEYTKCLSEIPGLKLFTVNQHEQRNYQYVVCEVDEKAAGISRDLLLNVLHCENVLARRYFYPGCHRMPPYHALYQSQDYFLSNTEKICQRVLLLPTGTTISRMDVQRISALLQFVVSHAAEVNQRASEGQPTALLTK